jgi:hypothetical protein
MTVQEDFFLLGEIAVYQLFITNPIVVNRRVILIREGATPVQVDYLVPRPVYERLAKGIEASIGTFRPM